MPPVISEQIKHLIILQKKDTECYALQRELDVMPEQLKRLEEEFKKKEVTLKALEEELTQVQLQRKNKEGEIKEKEEKIKKTQGQLFQVKTNKEYAALETEIKGVKADISVLEDQVLELFDATDALRARAEAEKKNLAEEKKKNDAEKARIQGEIQAKKTALEKARAERAELTGAVDPSILSRYDRLVENKEGLAIVPVVSNSCGGCFMALPPQVVNEVRISRELIFCENCLRILYCE